MPYVASTLSSDVLYTGYVNKTAKGDKAGAVCKIGYSVLVKGGANVANKLSTPEGVITGINDEQAAFLRADRLFQLHQSNGHVKIFERSVEPKKAAKDMKDRDSSSQLNEAKGDFKEGGRAAGAVPINTKVE